MPQTIINLLNKGAQANRADKFRQGNLISLPADAQLVISGDIHGHRRNFERLTAFADLENNPGRHVLLQEIIHGGPQDSKGGCLSYQLLFDAVDYKLTFPDRAHIIMGNHDTAFISGREVVKDGKKMNRSLRCALDMQFAAAGCDVEEAMKRFLFSQPLALRTANRIWLSHSLPGDRHVDKFDSHVLDRRLEDNDIIKPGSAYLLTWGRKHSRETLDKMAELFDVDIFILGHQPQKQGYSRAGPNLLIIASDHNHGCLLPLDLAQSYTIDQLIDSIVPLASIP